MTRQRVSPFAQGTPERIMHDRYRRAMREAEVLEKQAAVIMTEARAHRASADRYAEALRALGHGDKVPPIKALPNYAGLGEGQ